MAGDQSHNPTGAHNVEALRHEVVVNCAREVRTSPIRRIEDRVVAKRNIADHRIEEVCRKLRLFERLRMDTRIGVELSGDASGYGIKLNAGAFRVGIKTFGHHPEEMARAHRGFEDVRSRLQSEPFHCPPHCLNDFGGRVMRVRRRGARRAVLFVAECALQFVRDQRANRMEDTGQTNWREHPIPCTSRERPSLQSVAATGFCLNSLERADSGQIGLGLLFRTALADGVGAGYAEVAGKG